MKAVVLNNGNVQLLYVDLKILCWTFFQKNTLKRIEYERQVKTLIQITSIRRFMRERTIFNLPNTLTLREYVHLYTAVHVVTGIETGTPCTFWERFVILSSSTYRYWILLHGPVCVCIRSTIELSWVLNMKIMILSSEISMVNRTKITLRTPCRYPQWFLTTLQYIENIILVQFNVYFLWCSHQFTLDSIKSDKNTVRYTDTITQYSKICILQHDS